MAGACTVKSLYGFSCETLKPCSPPTVPGAKLDVPQFRVDGDEVAAVRSQPAALSNTLLRAVITAYEVCEPLPTMRVALGAAPAAPAKASDIPVRPTDAAATAAAPRRVNSERIMD